MSRRLDKHILRGAGVGLTFPASVARAEGNSSSLDLPSGVIQMDYDCRLGAHHLITVTPAINAEIQEETRSHPGISLPLPRDMVIHRLLLIESTSCEETTPLLAVARERLSLQRRKATAPATDLSTLEIITYTLATYEAKAFSPSTT